MSTAAKPHRNPELIQQLQDRFAEDLQAGRLTLGQAVKCIRKISGLTQVEFALDRGLSLLTLKRIETGKGNPTVETLERIGRMFELRVGFVRPSKDQASI